MAESGLTLMDARGTTPSVQRWPPEMFRYDMREAEARDRIQRMDVGGRARALFWGPYQTIGPGLWRATARIAVDRWACRHQYRLEWGATADYSMFAFSPRKAGIFEVSAERLWCKPEPAELRIVLAESSLGGCFELLDVTLDLVEGCTTPAQGV